MPRSTRDPKNPVDDLLSEVIQLKFQPTVDKLLLLHNEAVNAACLERNIEIYHLKQIAKHFLRPPYGRLLRRKPVTISVQHETARQNQNCSRYSLIGMNRSCA